MTQGASRKIGPLDLAGIERLASRMIRDLPKPLVLGLVGTLGAGKTTLVQAIARADDIDASDVTSPTFTLLQSHRGRTRTIHHLDAYRIADEDEFLELGVEELFDDAGAWTLVEWADRVRSVMPADALWIEIRIDDQEGQTRSVLFSTDDPSSAAAIDRIVKRF